MIYVPGPLLTVVAIETAAIAALLVDRTRRARAGRALSESESHFRLVMDRVPALLWTARPDTTLDYLNGTCAQYTGLPLEKLQDEGWLDLVHPDDRDYCVGVIGPAFEARTPFHMEYRLRRADGAYRWLLAMGVPKYGSDGTFTGYVGTDIDITERREAEDRIRESEIALKASRQEIRSLAGRLIAAQDAERARIARDLHDDLSQQLAGMSIALGGINRRLVESGASEDLQTEMRSLNHRLAALAQSVRHLSHDLHPTVLRHGGLAVALNSHCAELERLHGTVFKCCAEGDVDGIAPDAALCLYRIAQEALRNVVAHAGASRAEVRLFYRGGDAEITIVDDGHGFDLTLEMERGNGLGLVSIMERVRLAGGTIRVAAEPHQGTCVRATLPANGAANHRDLLPGEDERGLSLS